MIFYHGTTEDNWKTIQEEGVLWGRRYVTDNNDEIVKEISRCTYLTPNIEEARCYGDVVLKVEYDPYANKTKNNYSPDCWQVRVYEPIKIDKIERI